MFDNLFGKNALHLFGDPTVPKKNIIGGSLVMVSRDPGDRRTNQRGPRTPAVWIGLVLFWIVVIVAPIAIIQFFARR